MKKLAIAAFVAFTLATCGGGGGQRQTDTYEGYSESGPINNYSRVEITERQLDMINAVRAENGRRPLQISTELTAAALTHARDIAAQQRAWNYGSDKSTPQTRANRAGYYGIVTGENVSESFRGEIGVMQSWLSESMSRSVILDPRATHVGIAYFQEPSGKVWWVEDFGTTGASQTGSSAAATYPASSPDADL